MAEWADMTRQHNALENLIQNLKIDLQKKRPVLAVFDLDSTLFDVSPRIQRILEELRDHPETLKQYPDVIPHLKDVKTHRSDWGIKAALTRAFEKIKPLPHRNFHHHARDFWAKHFFSNEYLHFDHPVEGAVEFVNLLHGMGVEIAYLTGRDWDRMGPGTVEVLKKWKLPTPDDSTAESPIRLAMKPVAGSDDSVYKCGWFESIKPHAYSRILFFENEPKILHSVREHHPEIEIFFLQTTHSGKAEPDQAWTTISNFLKG